MKMPNAHSAPRGRQTLRMEDGGMVGLAGVAQAQADSAIANASFKPLPVPGLRNGGEIHMEAGGRHFAGWNRGEYMIRNDPYPEAGPTPPIDRMQFPGQGRVADMNHGSAELPRTTMGRPVGGGYSAPGQIDPNGNYLGPNGPGDNATFLTRNPGVATNYLKSPSPGQNTVSGPSGVPAPTATPGSPPPPGSPTTTPSVTPMLNGVAGKATGIDGVLSYGKNSFGDAAAGTTSPYTGPTAGGTPGHPTAETAATMDHLIAPHATWDNPSMGITGGQAWNPQQSTPQPLHGSGVALRNGGSPAINDGMGGKVPGSGKGDKIPAKYEPGEFVVSNAMLAAEPKLKAHLSHLRDSVLHAEGKDPRAVDAKQVHAAGLRNGGELHMSQGGIGGAYDQLLSSVRSAWNRTTGPTTGQTQQGFTGDDWAAPAGAPEAAPISPPGSGGPEIGAPKMGSATGQPKVDVGDLSQYAPGGGPAKPVAAASTEPPGFFRQAGAAIKQPISDLKFKAPEGSGFWSKAGTAISGALDTPGAVGESVGAAGNAIGEAGANAGKFVGRNAGRLAYLAGALPHAAAYADDKISLGDKLRLGGEDLIRAGGTAIGGAFGGGVGSAILPVGGTIAGGLAGGYGGDRLGHSAAEGMGLGGDAILTKAGYDPNRSVIDMATDAMNGKTSLRELGGGKSAPGAAQAPAEASVTPTPIDPNAPAVKGGGTTPTDTNYGVGDTGVTKTVGADGKVTYSNGGAGTLRGGGNLSVVPGMSQQEIDSALTNTDGSRWSAGDNAIMAANIRDGIDPYRGTSQGRANDAKAAEPKLGDFGYNHFQANKLANRQIDATLMGHKMTNAFGMMKLRQDQSNWQNDFNQKADNQTFEQKSKAQADIQKTLEARSTDIVDGKPVLNQAKMATHIQGINGFLNGKVQALNAAFPPGHPQHAQAQAIIAGIQKNGAAGVNSTDLERILTGEEAKQRTLDGSSTWAPGFGKFVDNSDPTSYLPSGQNDNGEFTSPSGSTVAKRRLTYDNQGNFVLPDWFGNHKTTRFTQ